MSVRSGGRGPFTGVGLEVWMKLSSLVRSRTLLAAGVLVSVIVPIVTFPRLPHVSPWPVLLGVAPWLVGKYVLCPLRWRAVTPAARDRRWHLRAFAEGELLGLLTPGHVGSDVWRVKRLTGTGLGRGDAVISVVSDRVVGALGLALFVVLAGATLPPSTALVAAGVTATAIVAVLVVRLVRPDLLPRRPLPPPRRLAEGFVYSALYQLSLAALLMGTVDATGHDLSPLAVLGAFGVSQVAGVVPGPNGASPRDGALVAALMALGIPLAAALAAVAVKAVIAWAPALVLGGTCLLLGRRALRRTPAGAVTPA